MIWTTFKACHKVGTYFAGRHNTPFSWIHIHRINSPVTESNGIRSSYALVDRLRIAFQTKASLPGGEIKRSIQGHRWIVSEFVS